MLSTYDLVLWCMYIRFLGKIDDCSYGVSSWGDKNLKSNPISSPFCKLLNAGLKAG